ncbi:ADAMTS-like protein 2 [Parus major]|uniref:ADAMTS-like protein 2 n=1 Tax=Parus major TaxID=9157 RepID=UPI001443958A|nr:ADAMTS-like protein 2 [Parus major]
MPGRAPRAPPRPLPPLVGPPSRLLLRGSGSSSAAWPPLPAASSSSSSSSSAPPPPSAIRAGRNPDFPAEIPVSRQKSRFQGRNPGFPAEIPTLRGAGGAPASTDHKASCFPCRTQSWREVLRSWCGPTGLRPWYLRPTAACLGGIQVTGQLPVVLSSQALQLTMLCFCQDSSEAADGAGVWDEEVTKWWGEWSSWSTCSRSCGGGVMSRERHCLRQRLQMPQGTNSTMCVGQAKRYQLCQQQPCPANTASFKQQQCSSFNAKAFGKRYYHWMPLYPDDYTSISNKPCDLQCTTRSGERQLMARAQDGTSCKDRTYQGVCINGKCEPVGCDGSLYSPRTMDRCRVCGGDGSTCHRVSGTFRKAISQIGYVFITNIPAGATDILIIERRKTENILALADESGHFFFNGNSAIDNPQNFRVAGTIFKYRRPSSLTSDGLEYIIAHGPTNQSLNAMYYNFNGKMPHITYDYTVPRTPPLRTAAPALVRPLYHPLPETSQSHHPIPANSRAAQDFNATWLSLSPDDTSVQLPLRGGQEDLDFGPPHFFQTNSTSQTRDWGWEQSEEKEKYDFQIRQVYHANTAGEEEEEEAAAVGGETELALRFNQISISTAVPYSMRRPELENSRVTSSRLRLFRRLCHRDPHNAAFCRELQPLAARLAPRNSTARLWPRWPQDLHKALARKNSLEDLKVEAFAGSQGEAANYSTMASVESPVLGASPTDIGQAEPLRGPGTESNEFDVSPVGHDDISLADMYRWKVSAYAPCSSTCTSGISTSYAMCVRYDGVEVDESYCDALTRPEPTHEFCTGRDCQPRWETSRWSECSRTCGEGFQYRTVRCWKMLAPGFDSSVYDDLCEAVGLARPMERKACKNKACGPQWELSEWSECSARCGTPGTMKREVRCSVEAPLCDESRKPSSEKPCTGPPCDRRWTASEWGPCSGSCGEGRMSRFIACRNLEGKVISSSQCDPATKPLAVHPCGDKNCPAHWVEQEWEQCDASCGRGMKTRLVLCVGLENGLYREYPEKRCETSPKPEEQAACFRRPCSTWFTTSWSQCSKTCGAGVRLREVKCYQGEALAQGCDPSAKPEARQTCQLQPCPTEAPEDACEDKATANCVLVLKVKLCSHWYYRKACCWSCRLKSP